MNARGQDGLVDVRLEPLEIALESLRQLAPPSVVGPLV